MEAPDWYAGWRHEAVHELMAKQDAVSAEYRISEWPRYDYDLDACTLTFSREGVAKVVADIQVVGTTSSHDWMWGWANAHWPSTSIDDMARVHDFGVEHGIEQLTSKYLTDDDLNDLGWVMTAVSARILDGVGAYRPPRPEGGGLFLVYRSIKFVS